LIEKSSTVVPGVTVRLAAAVCDAGGELYWPVTVKPKIPVAAVVVVETMSVELSPARTDAGAKLALAPAGNPEAERLTIRAAPTVASVPTAYVVVEPWTTTRLDGLTLMEKSLRA
jgi:hypothetical protein